MEIFQRFKDLREDAELTQNQAAKIGYISKNTYIRYEKGETSIPFEIAVLYAKYYKVSLDYLAGITNIKNQSNQEQENYLNVKRDKYEKSIKKIYKCIEELEQAIY